MGKVDRWIPVLKGDTYCSPACGGGCTKAEFDEATSKAEELATRMGPGWKAHVWENLGWYWEVTNGVARLSMTDDGRYHVCIDLSPYAAPVDATADTPEDAFGFASQDARTNIDRAKAAMDALLSF
jgi:hypothetical protein